MAPMATAVPSTFLKSPPTTAPTPSKPVLRRSTLSGTIRTRDEAGLDDMLDLALLTPPSPSKRARTVTFNPMVDTQIFSSSASIEETNINIEDVKRDVKSTIENHSRGLGGERYERLKDIFKPVKRGQECDSPSNDKIRANLLALTNCVSLLGEKSFQLIKLVLEFEWMGRDESLMKVYVHFLGNLASAQGLYVPNILSMIVDKFTAIRLTSGRLNGSPVVNREQLTSRVHVALKYLLRLIPSASSTLAHILASKFPFSASSKKLHLTYIRNLVRILDYAPELRDEIFALIIERLIKIDVQMQTDLDDVEDTVAAAIAQTLSLQTTRPAFSEHDEDDSNSDDDSDTSDDDEDEEVDRIKEIQDNVEKMDAVLDLLFQVYTPYFTDPNSSSANSMFQTLLSHFRNIILPTYRSRHTQFILFHFAQTSEHHIDEFAGECVDLAFKSGNAAILRQSAAAYLASFVSRGAHVRPDVVRDVFDFIGAQLDKIRTENEKSCRGPDLQRYGIFYATTQALLYIFCFRWRDLTVTESDEDIFDEGDVAAFVGHDLDWRDGVRDLLHRTIYSRLNPLKVCAPQIVEEFAKISHRLNFMYVFPLLETNKRVRLSQFTLGAGSNGNILRDSGFGTRDSHVESWHQLDAYFPFDPYQLPMSRHWVENDYVKWRGIPEKDDDDNSDDEASGDEVDEADEDEFEEDSPSEM